MGLALTGTRYITDTDDLLMVADEKTIIEAADDPEPPNTYAKSFAELDAAAVTGGAGSDAEKVRDKVLATLVLVVKAAESIVESYGKGLYVLPFAPLDSVLKTLIADWTWYRLRVRRGMYRAADDQRSAERTLIDKSVQVRDETLILSAVRLDIGSLDLIYSYGTSDRRTFLDDN
jgi:phage gp36-like protein